VLDIHSNPANPVIGRAIFWQLSAEQSDCCGAGFHDRNAGAECPGLR